LMYRETHFHAFNGTGAVSIAKDTPGGRHGTVFIRAGETRSDGNFSYVSKTESFLQVGTEGVIGFRHEGKIIYRCGLYRFRLF
jgi:hypothetical protein